MQCLRCGKEIDDAQVFCGDCLEVMDKQPVKPHTVVTIPDQSIRDRNEMRSKSPRTEEPLQTPEPSLGKLRLCIGMLTAALVLCICWITWQELYSEQGPAIGQNYTSIENQAQGGR